MNAGRDKYLVKGTKQNYHSTAEKVLSWYTSVLITTGKFERQMELCIRNIKKYKKPLKRNTHIIIQYSYYSLELKNP